jgi:hypothetical protein
MKIKNFISSYSSSSAILLEVIIGITVSTSRFLATASTEGES